MRKLLTSTLGFAAAGILFAGAAAAQQGPAPKSAAGQTPPAKSGQGAAAAKKPAATASAATLLKTDKDKRSYAVGLNIGAKVANELKAGRVEMDPALLARGIRDSLTGAKHLLTDEEVKTSLTALETELNERARKDYEAMAEANKKEGDEFLAANKGKEGVQTLPSGLQYKILKAGSGPKPVATDKVTCNYKGSFTDGKEFDSSERHGGKPVTFAVAEVIKGWTEALQMMPVGSKWQLFVPAELAYGPNGFGREIAPNKSLVFEIELVAIEPKTDAKPEAAKPDAQPEARKPDTKPNSN